MEFNGLHYKYMDLKLVKLTQLFYSEHGCMLLVIYLKYNKTGLVPINKINIERD